MSEQKTKPTLQTPGDFINAMADQTRRSDCLALMAMMEKACKAKPVMWGSSMIGFGKYHYRYDSGREGDWYILGFSPRKNDFTLYITAGLDEHAALLKSLGKHKTGKACLYIKQLADIDVSVLQKLFNAAVKAMASKRVE
jgi:hypothetical protein